MRCLHPVICALVLGLLASCSNDGRDFEQAKAGNTIEGLDGFLEKHRDSKHSAEARSLLAVLQAKILVRKDETEKLMKAVADGSIQSIKEMLNRGAEVNPTQVAGYADNYTPLMEAARRKRLDVAELLVNRGANVTKQCKRGFSATHLACEVGALDVLERLVALGARLDATTNQGATPLIYAAHGGHLDCVRYIVGCGANVDLQVSAAYRVAKSGQKLEVLQYLDRAASRRELQSVVLAAMLDDLGLLKHSLEKGVDPSASDVMDNNALVIATSAGHLGMVEALLNAGANPFVSVTSKSGITTIARRPKVMAQAALSLRTRMSPEQDMLRSALLKTKPRDPKFFQTTPETWRKIVDLLDKAEKSRRKEPSSDAKNK